MKKLIALFALVFTTIFLLHADGPNCISQPQFILGENNNCNAQLTGVTGMNMGATYVFSLYWLSSSCVYGPPCNQSPVPFPYCAADFISSVNSNCCETTTKKLGVLRWLFFDETKTNSFGSPGDWVTNTADVMIPPNIINGTVYFYTTQCSGNMQTNCAGVHLDYCFQASLQCEAHGGGNGSNDD